MSRFILTILIAPGDFHQNHHCGAAYMVEGPFLSSRSLVDSSLHFYSSICDDDDTEIKVGSFLTTGDFDGDATVDYPIGQEGRNPAVCLGYGPLSGAHDVEKMDLCFGTHTLITPKEGYSISEGDLDGDGRDDFALGMPYCCERSDGEEPERGAVVLFYGATLDTL